MSSVPYPSKISNKGGVKVKQTKELPIPQKGEKKMKIKQRTHRQGDVYLVPIPKDEANGNPVPLRPIALGEATGHAHRLVDLPEDEKLQDLFGSKRFGPDVLERNTSKKRALDDSLMHLPLSPNVELYTNSKNELVLRVKTLVALVHEEHQTQRVFPGGYKYVPQQEKNPWAGWVRQTD